ncbi:MAG: hypothetical protein FWG63_11915 [Defluviitaleaceae bacterium]|nr:hypothetical protein [Defluviitaleaceae bacterium]
MKADFENQLDVIRVNLNELTKGMPNSEAVRFTNENARKIADQYGIKLTKSTVTYTDERLIPQ